MMNPIHLDLTPLGTAMAAVLGWLVTYLVHSTVLLGGALAVRLALRGRRPVLEEGVWKVAVTGGLATATLALGLAWIAPAAPSAPALLSVTAGTAMPGAEVGTLEPGPRGAVHSAIAIAATTEATPASSEMASALAAMPGSLARWAFPLLAVWAFGALAFVLYAGLCWVRLFQRLASRQPVDSGRLPRLLARLLRATSIRRPVSLTESSRLEVPCALGVTRPEVCLPRRAIQRLSPAQQETVLAHEVAHLARRDPLWLGLLQAIEAVLFLQPLNRLARIRLQELFEHRCDDWAVDQTGQRVEMARCLTEVASWMVARSALPVPSLGQRGSALKRRVERLLDAGHRPIRERAPRAALAAAVAAVALAGWALPSFVPALEADEGMDGREMVEARDLAAADVARLDVTGSEVAGRDPAGQGPAAARVGEREPPSSPRALSVREGLIAVADDLERLAAAPRPDRESLDRVLSRAAELYAVAEGRFGERLADPDLEPDQDPSPEWIARKAREVRGLALRLQEGELAHHRLDRLSEDDARAMAMEYRARAEAIADKARLSEEEIQALRSRYQAQAEEIARQARPSEEEMDALRARYEEHAAAVSERQRLSRAQIERLTEGHAERLEVLQREQLQRLDVSQEHHRQAIAEMKRVQEGHQERLERSAEDRAKAMATLQSALERHQEGAGKIDQARIEQMMKQAERQLDASQALQEAARSRALEAAERVRVHERSFGDDPERLREQKLRLEEQIEQLQRRLEETSARLKARLQDSDSGGPPP